MNEKTLLGMIETRRNKLLTENQQNLALGKTWEYQINALRIEACADMIKLVKKCAEMG